MKKIYLLRRGAKGIFTEKKVICQESVKGSNSKYCLACTVCGVLPLEGITLKELKRKISFKSKFLDNIRELESTGALVVSWDENYLEESKVYFHEKNCLDYAGESLW